MVYSFDCLGINTTNSSSKKETGKKKADCENLVKKNDNKSAFVFGMRYVVLVWCNKRHLAAKNDGQSECDCEADEGH